MKPRKKRFSSSTDQDKTKAYMTLKDWKLSTLYRTMSRAQKTPV